MKILYIFRSLAVWGGIERILVDKMNYMAECYDMDVYLLTYPDLPWVPDPARSNGSDAIRMELFNRYEAEIQALDIPYYIIKHC